jgi:hypothetical protein
MPREHEPCLCGAEDCPACHPEWNQRRKRHEEEDQEPDWQDDTPSCLFHVTTSTDRSG